MRNYNSVAQRALFHARRLRTTASNFQPSFHMSDCFRGPLHIRCFSAFETESLDSKVSTFNLSTNSTEEDALDWSFFDNNSERIKKLKTTNKEMDSFGNQDFIFDSPSAVPLPKYDYGELFSDASFTMMDPVKSFDEPEIETPYDNERKLVHESINAILAFYEDKRFINEERKPLSPVRYRWNKAMKHHREASNVTRYRNVANEPIDDLTKTSTTEVSHSDAVDWVQDRDSRDATVIDKGLCLLRAMTEMDFETFDEVTREESFENEQEDEARTTSAADENLAIDKDSINLQRETAMEIVVDMTAEQLQALDKTPQDLDGPDSSFSESLALIKRAKNGSVYLSTDAFNILLLRFALADDLRPSEILTCMMESYDLMVDLPASQPDATTQEILLLALTKRLGVEKIGKDLIKQLMDSGVHWSTAGVDAAVRTCTKCHDVDLALRVIKHTEADKIIIAPATYLVAARAAKRYARLDVATHVMRSSLQVHTDKDRGFDNDVVTDKLIIELFHWPSLDRNKRRFDNSFVLEQFYAILETCNYRPGERVFQQIISSALRDLQKEARPARAKLAHKAMTRLKTEHPFFEVSPSFLNLCLKVCEGTGDLYLAADTLSRAIQRSTGDYFLNNFTSSTTDVSYHDIAKTLRLCAGDSNALDSVVSSIQSVDHILPLAGYRLMMEQIIRNFAALGKPERSMQILQSMVDKGISPSEDAYGIVIQGFAPKNPQEALRIFDSIESPGPSAYNGLILSQVCSQAWDDVIATFSSLIAAGINPLPTSYHGVLLSYYRKDPEQARAFLYDIADQKIDLPTGSYKLAASILLGLSDDSDKEKRLTIDNLRDKIKDMNADNPHVKKATLNVMRSLRMAEQEEKREPSGLLTGEDIRIRRRMAWNEFLLHLVEFSKVTT